MTAAHADHLDGTSKPIEGQTENAQHDGDVLLHALVARVNRTGLRFDVMLFTPSGMLSGHVVSGRDWAEAMAQNCEEATGNAGAIMAGNFRNYGTRMYPDPTAGDDVITEHQQASIDPRLVTFIHLLNAHVWEAGVRTPASGGIPMRIRLDSISGWTMGAFTTGTPSGAEGEESTSGTANAADRLAKARP